MCAPFTSERISLVASATETCAWPAGEFTNDEVGTLPLLDMLTDAQSVAANLRIMANISDHHHNEAEDAALMIHHQHSTAITHETMESGGGYFGDKTERVDECGERDTRSMMQLYPRCHPEQTQTPRQSNNHWLQHLSMLSNDALLDVQMPYAQVATEMMPELAANRKWENTQREDKGKISGKNARRLSSRGTGPLSKEQQRRNACVRERTRMRDMNQAFDTLRQRLPNIKQPGKRTSKIEALRLTIKYIRELKSMLDEYI